MRRTALLAAGLALLPLVAQARAPAPAADCLDARGIERVHAVDENTLVLDAVNGWFVVAHAAGCTVRDKARLLAADGWACGAGKEFVQVGETLCPVLSVTRVDGRTYAGLAAAADRRGPAIGGTPSLAPVQVEARAPRAVGFRGDSSYCFSPAAVRGWQLDGSRQLVVQTSPRRAGGKKSYRVELDGSCPELAWADAIEFRSGLGMGMICGHAGDRAFAHDDGIELGVDEREPTRFALRGCGIAAVWPED
jgi:hypothetical protein